MESRKYPYVISIETYELEDNFGALVNTLFYLKLCDSQIDKTIPTKYDSLYKSYFYKEIRYDIP